MNFSAWFDKMDLEFDMAALKKNVGNLMTGDLSDEEMIMQAGKNVMTTVILDIVTKGLKNLHKAKNETYELISGLTGLELSKVSEMSIKDIKTVFTELIKHEDFSDFFG